MRLCRIRKLATIPNLFGVWAVLVALVFPGAAARAQDDWNSISPSDSVVSFGVVTTGETDSVLVTLTNSLTVGVQVLEATFEEEVFSTDLDGKTVPALGNLDFHIYLSTEQNVDYTDFLRIELDEGVRPLIIEVSAQAHYPDAYYDGTQNLWAEDLKDALTAIIDDHNSVGYTTARDSMYGHIDNVDGWVECVYTGRTAFFNTRAGATANGFNCEHTWPQSFSGEAEPMKSDIFHLYPSDETANNKRANLDFGIVVSATWSVGGSKLGTDSEGQTVFEPRDVHKGNVARSHFYYIIRYDGNYNLYQDPAKMEGHFRSWHVSDPVNSAEEQRNEDIFNMQYNRNPFIDHPGLADRISSFFGTATHELSPEIATAPGAIDMGLVGFTMTVHTYVAVLNTGTDTLDVTSIASTNPDFGLNKTSMSLAPETYEYVRITYTSGEVELMDSTSIVILSNDDDESPVTVPVTVEVGDVSGINETERGPAGIFLYQNRPNPFSKATRIRFDLPEPARVTLRVYDAHGRMVKQLVAGAPKPAGSHLLEWDGTNGVGQIVSPGLYFARMETGTYTKTRRMVFMR